MCHTAELKERVGCLGVDESVTVPEGLLTRLHLSETRRRARNKSAERG